MPRVRPGNDGGMLWLVLAFVQLFSQLPNRPYGKKPIATITLLITNFIIFAIDAGHVNIDAYGASVAWSRWWLCSMLCLEDVIAYLGLHTLRHIDCLIPSDIIREYMYYGVTPKTIRRILLSPLHHGSIHHLVMNMSSLVHNGSMLEDLFGTPMFAGIVLVMTVMCGVMDVLLSAIAYEFFAYDEFHACSIGFSGVLFALAVVSASYTMRSPHMQGRQSFFGLFDTGGIGGFILQAIMIQMMMPNAAFIGHLSGILVGAIFVKVILPRIMWW